jgi:hypothetical protein
MTPCLLPETAAAGASAAPAADLEPHQKLEAIAARLAASVGDASELVSAARMLQNDGEGEEELREREKERESPPFFPPGFR